MPTRGLQRAVCVGAIGCGVRTGLGRADLCDFDGGLGPEFTLCHENLLEIDIGKRRKTLLRYQIDTVNIHNKEETHEQNRTQGLLGQACDSNARYFSVGN